MIKRGGLTFDAEGQEGGRYHSRRLHVPGRSSGVTVGRGYDCGTKSAAKIYRELKMSGLNPIIAKDISRSSGLKGGRAIEFISLSGFSKFEISIEVQEKLFDISYSEIESTVKRICAKRDCVAAYGSVDWDDLNGKIKGVLIDLCFRGDYTGTSRKVIQGFVAGNDINGFSIAIFDRENWRKVPSDRFMRRVNYLRGES